MNLTHPARHDTRRYNWQGVLVGVNTLEEFEEALFRDWLTYSKTLGINYESPSDVEREKQEKNKYLGDAFEVFTEMFLLTQSVGLTGVANYRPLNYLEGDKDIGVDGVGIGTNNKPSAVQVKFRSNPGVELFAKADGLSGFVAASQNVYGVDIADTTNMWVVTNCAGINQQSKDIMLFGKVGCLGRPQITKLVDDVIPWWDSFRAATLPILPKTGRRPRTSLI
jgi:predicted helicase